MDFLGELARFRPRTPTEQRARDFMLRVAERRGEASLTRRCTLAHFTASAIVLSADGAHVLFACHRLYRSWAWLGGHADGQADLLAVARREALEESGARGLVPLGEGPISLEVLHVAGHVKKGRPVAPHLHLNFTYAFICPAWRTREPALPLRILRCRFLPARGRLPLRPCPGENRAAAWLPAEALARFVRETEFLPLYRDLICRARQRLT